MRFTAQAAGTAYRLVRFFKKPTVIMVQVKHATAKFFFDYDQSGAQSGGALSGTDGIVLNAASTTTPFTFTVVGEFWWSCDTAGADMIVLFVPDVEA